MKRAKCTIISYAAILDKKKVIQFMAKYMEKIPPKAHRKTYSAFITQSGINGKHKYLPEMWCEMLLKSVSKNTFQIQ